MATPPVKLSIAGHTTQKIFFSQNIHAAIPACLQCLKIPKKVSFYYILVPKKSTFGAKVILVSNFTKISHLRTKVNLLNARADLKI